MLQYKISLPIPDKNESSGAADWPRSHSKEEQINVWDIKLAGYVNYVGMGSFPPALAGPQGDSLVAPSSSSSFSGIFLTRDTLSNASAWFVQLLP